MTFIRTARGYMSLLNPRPEFIDIGDVARRLSMLCRFGGDVSAFFSVAQHAVNVAADMAALKASPRQQLVGLLHDAHEAYLGDIITPAEEAMFADLPAVEPHPLANLKSDLDAAIMPAFGIHDYGADRDTYNLIRRCDARACVAERIDLRGESVDAERCAFAIKPMAPDRAEQLFRKTFDQLSALAATPAPPPRFIPTGIIK